MTQHKDYHEFLGGMSASSIAFGGPSAVGTGIPTDFGFSLTNFASAGQERYTINATDTSAANANAGLATLTRILGKKGILDVTG